MSTRRRKHHSAEQIVKKLRGVETMLTAGKTVAELVQALEVSDMNSKRILATFAVGALIVALSPISMSAPRSYWYEDYVRTLELIENDQLDEAFALLETVIEKRPQPDRLVRTPGNTYVSYLPYLERARIHARKGNYDASRQSLELSENYGESLKDNRAKRDLERLRQMMPAGSSATVAAKD